jgi:hypothetical protein
LGDFLPVGLLLDAHDFLNLVTQRKGDILATFYLRNFNTFSPNRQFKTRLVVGILRFKWGLM